jgi:RHS repeat-associated protein
MGQTLGYSYDALDRHYVRARHLDTGLGRWLSPDPIGDAGGWPVYGYVGGGPVGHGDPCGLQAMPYYPPPMPPPVPVPVPAPAPPPGPWYANPWVWVLAVVVIAGTAVWVWVRRPWQASPTPVADSCAPGRRQVWFCQCECDGQNARPPWRPNLCQGKVREEGAGPTRAAARRACRGSSS